MNRNEFSTLRIVCDILDYLRQFDRGDFKMMQYVIDLIKYNPEKYSIITSQPIKNRKKLQITIAMI